MPPAVRNRRQPWELPDDDVTAATEPTASAIAAFATIATTIATAGRRRPTIPRIG